MSARGDQRPGRPDAAQGSRIRPGAERPSSADALARLPASDLAEVFRFWSKDQGGRPPSGSEWLDQVQAWMSDPDRALDRIESLGRRVATVFDLLLAGTRYELSMAELAAHRDVASLSAYDLEAALTVLLRRALAFPVVSSAAHGNGGQAYCVPTEVGDAVLRGRRARRRGIFDTFTLRGHLDRIYDDPARAARTPPSRVRELYKMYAKEAAAVARIERLPEGLRALTCKIILEFGGIFPKDLFERIEADLPHWNGRRWAKILGESLVGTVERIDLAGYGIKHSAETFIVFNEVALAWLRRVAVPSDPDRPHDEASLGVDLVSNISRFISFVLDNDVRFTVRGEIFKTTEKRILAELIPNPGRELERTEVLQFIYRLAREDEWLQSTGERTFVLTSKGRAWEPQSLDEKLHVLFNYIVEEPDLGGEYYHQVRMRRLFLRLLKRIEAGVWYDIMYVPFLARNQYLCSLDELEVDGYFAERGPAGCASEDLQRMAWNLVSWVRKRLYLLGIVDLGYDSQGRPVAMRLSRQGARLIGIAGPEDSQPTLGALVVTPDFEVVLFPTGDDDELVHDLDRFADRDGSGALKQFRITERSVARGLGEGLALARMVELLEHNARTPVPQNVLYSIRDWSLNAGLLELDGQLIVRAPNAGKLQELLADPGMRPLIKATLDETSLQLESDGSPARVRALVRDLGYLVELID